MADESLIDHGLFAVWSLLFKLATCAMVYASYTASKSLFPRTPLVCLPSQSAGLWAVFVGANWSSTGTTMATPSWAWYMAPGIPLCCWPNGERVLVVLIRGVEEKSLGEQAGSRGSRLDLGSILVLPALSHHILAALGSASCTLSICLLGFIVHRTSRPGTF